MLNRKGRNLNALATIFLLLFFSAGSEAQQLLNRIVNISANRQPVTDVLEIISNQANFYFSYNSNIIRKDSLVTVAGGNKTVKAVLDQLFPSGFEFRESGNYLIIRRAPLKITLVTEQSASNDNIYQVSGYVRDDQTGERIPDASVYEKQRLASALTDDNGYFRLKLRSRYKKAALTVSKEFYEDTTVIIQAGFNQQITITLSPANISGADVIIGPGRNVAPDSIYIAIPQPDSSSILYLYKKMDSIRVQRTGMGKFLLSSRLKMQSINLSKFFTVRPVQVSLTPGLSSNGKLNPQVINNFSFNVFGGYSGGVNGFELGGLFNLDKKNVQYVQIGGLLNIVGGSMTGLQIGGLNNTVLDTANGVQIGGINNFVRSKYKGVQVAGIYNHTGDRMQGVQLAGIANFTNRKTSGLQLAGIGNVTGGAVAGVQISGIINYTKRLKGVQVGLINIADSSEGYSIGLINVVFKGYHKLAFYSTEVLPFNGAFKTGNSKLYSILLGGATIDSSQRMYSFGYGIGTEYSFSKMLKLNGELSSQYMYLGSWEYLNLLNRASLSLQVRFGKFFAIYAGPAFSVYLSDQDVQIKNYKLTVPDSRYKTFDMGKNMTGWLGWNAGIHIF